MSELLELARKIAAQAKDGEQIKVSVGRETEVEVKAAQGDLEAFSSATSEQVAIWVVNGGRMGIATVGSLEPPLVEDALAEARDNAAFASADEHAGLAEPDGVSAVEIDRWRDDIGETSAADKIATAIDIERRIVSADPRISGVRQVIYADSQNESAMATSLGIEVADRATHAYVTASVLADDGDATRTGYGLTFGRAFADLDLDRVVHEGVDRTLRMLGAQKPKTAHLPVVLDPSVASSVLALIASLCDGEEVLKGRSMFEGRLGEQIATAGFTLVEDPTNPDAFMAKAFDSDGLACRRVELIDDGVLKSFLYDARWARAAGTKSTGSSMGGGIGCRAVAPVIGSLDEEQILGAVGDGVYIPSVSGLHSGVNPVSGDFSVGAEGLMIRDGKLAEPVNEFTIASTIQRLLQSIAHVGSDLEWGPGQAARLTMAFDDVQVSGQ